MPLDNLMRTTKDAERLKLARRESGNRRRGWSAAYGKLITDLHDLVAVARPVPGSLSLEAVAAERLPERTEVVPVVAPPAG